MWEDLLKRPEQYEHAHGTNYIRQLSYGVSIPPELYADQTQQDWPSYLQSLLDNLWGAQIRIQWPTVFKEGQATPLMPGKPVEEGLAANKLKEALTSTPQYACGVPVLAGTDIFCLRQFFETTLSYHSTAKEKATGDGHVLKKFAGAKAIVMASATIQRKIEEAIHRVASGKGWRVEKKVVEEIPYQFNVTALKTQSSISLSKLEQIVIDLAKIPSTKALVVVRTKAEAEELFRQITRCHQVADHVGLFYEENFEWKRRGGLGWRVLLSYPRAALTRGMDFPELLTILVDCSAFPPTFALEGLKAEMGKGEKQVALLEELQDLLTQLFGRSFRSLLPREKGQTVKDPRPICLAMFNLPEFALAAGADQTLCYQYQEIAEIWISTTATVESVVESIQAALAGQALKDWGKINREKLGKRAAVKAAGYGGLENVTPTQRNQVDKQALAEKREQRNKETQQKRQKARLEKLKKKVLAMKGEGKEWRDIERAFSLHRYKEIIEILKQFFE